MNSKLSFVHAFMRCLLLPAALGLVCYQCKSTVSWERCRTTTKTCHPNNDRCGKVYFKVGDVDTFLKDCIPKAECAKKANHFCKGAAECEVICCDKHDCNAGSAFLISGILFMASALVSVMTLVKA